MTSYRKNDQLYIVYYHRDTCQSVAFTTLYCWRPKAQNAVPGSADLCLITETDMGQAMLHVKNCGIEIIEGAVERTGATSKPLSFYIRDPDQNLIEIANILSSSAPPDYCSTGCTMTGERCAITPLVLLKPTTSA